MPRWGHSYAMQTETQPVCTQGKGGKKKLVEKQRKEHSKCIKNKHKLKRHLKHLERAVLEHP